MELERIDPALRPAVERLGSISLGGAVGRALSRVAPRLMRWPRERHVRVASARVGGVRVRTYAPAQRRTDVVLLWIHGGGMTGGAPHIDDPHCSEIAARVGIRIVSVDYRLAPEHPFPVPLDDCASVWAGLVERGHERIAVGGQSAGGGLAAALAQRLLDEGGPQPIAQLLFCPMLDDRTAADRSLDAIEHAVWSNADNLAGWSAYLGTPPGSADLPAHAVPARREELRGLPPAWIGVGDIDLFHAEDTAYAERLRAAGVDARLVVVPAAPHGFESLAFDTAIAADFRRDAQRWLVGAVGGP